MKLKGGRTKKKRPAKHYAHIYIISELCTGAIGIKIFHVKYNYFIIYLFYH